MEAIVMHTPSPITLLSNPPSLNQKDDHPILESKAEYQKQLKKWQKRLLTVQQAYFHQKRRALIVMEGWDAAGKGGAIRRITEKLDPRGFTVYPISAPTQSEQGKHYLYRFQTKLPAPGHIAIFDRSWYGRVLVERVEQFASPNEWQRAYQEINEFERMLLDDNARIIKLFLNITPEEQLKRFTERLENPLKRWKLTQEDIRNRQRWHQYEEAINDMFAYTSTTKAPWQTISADHKWYTRVEVLKTIVKQLEEGVDLTPPRIDPDVLASARKNLDFDMKID
jgi:PPK2 family polyphosphate:nucleotide phosphotransferase